MKNLPQFSQSESVPLYSRVYLPHCAVASRSELRNELMVDGVI